MTRFPYMRRLSQWWTTLLLMTCTALPAAGQDDGVRHYLMIDYYRLPDHEPAPRTGWGQGWQLSAQWCPTLRFDAADGTWTYKAYGVSLSKALGRCGELRLGTDLTDRGTATWTADGAWNLTTYYNGYDTRRMTEWVATAGVALGSTAAGWRCGGEIGMQLRHTLTRRVSLYIEPQIRVMAPPPGAGREDLFDDALRVSVGLQARLTSPYRTGGYGHYVRAISHGSEGQKVPPPQGMQRLAWSVGQTWWDGHRGGVKTDVTYDVTAVHGLRLSYTGIGNVSGGNASVGETGNGARWDAFALDYVANLTHAALGNAERHRWLLLLTCGYNLTIHNKGHGWLHHSASYVGLDAGLRIEARISQHISLTLEPQLLVLPFDPYLDWQPWHSLLTGGVTLRL